MVRVGETINVRVLRVVDGDTLEVKRLGFWGWFTSPFRVRLYGIDAPELRQGYGRESTAALAELVQGSRRLRMEVIDFDRYDRVVGLLYRKGQPRTNSVNVAMIRSGHAYWYQRYGGRDLGFGAAEQEAKRAHRGVWASRTGDEAPPWEYRAAQRRGRVGIFRRLLGLGFKTLLVLLLIRRGPFGIPRRLVGLGVVVALAVLYILITQGLPQFM